MKTFNRLFNIIISAICVGLAQHPLGLGCLAWFCLVPLFIAIKDNLNYINTETTCGSHILKGHKSIHH